MGFFWQCVMALASSSESEEKGELLRFEAAVCDKKVGFAGPVGSKSVSFFFLSLPENG